MINREQFLLLKLAEECAEVAQRASKSIRFATTRCRTGRSHERRARDELGDLITTIAMIVEETEHIARIEPGSAIQIAQETRAKINKYYEYSIALGRVE